MLWQTFWYIICLFMFITSWRNNNYCNFQGQLMCQLKTIVHCKNVIFFTFNYHYLAHNRPKWSTLYVLYPCVTYRTLYEIFTLHHKTKVGQVHNFRKKLTKFHIFRYIVVIIITIWFKESMENVVINILVYYMSSYVHYYLKKITVIAFFKVKWCAS